MLKKNSKFQTFTDGWGSSWEVVDRKLKERKQEIIHFQEQTVGERRHWDAYVAGVQITRAIRVPYESKVNQGDIFIINGQQYEVAQKERKDDRLPKSWLLSLVEAVIEYREVQNGQSNS